MSEQIIQQAVSAGIQRVLAGKDQKIKIRHVAKDLLSDPKLAELITFDGLRHRIGRAIKAGDAPIEDEPVIKMEVEVKKSEPKPFVLSAWNYDSGKMMDIEEYCTHYNLPKEDILEYKLVTHTGVPYYNTRFRESITPLSDFSLDQVEAIIQKLIERIEVTYIGREDSTHQWFDRAVWTDFHNGMDTNKNGVAMYATPWNFDEQKRRVEMFAKTIIENQKGEELIVDDLGDYQDGYNGETVRGGHHLPQNKGNELCFDDGVYFKVYLGDLLAPYYKRITFNNITNDNHSGSFGYVTNSAVKTILELKYKHIQVVNHQQFINHYFVGNHAFVITHGKDDKTLKFGFKPKLDAVQIEKIQGYLKHNNIPRKADYIEFSKGDSHQMLLDYCTSDDFTYFNYPAFSPSSEWVQNNFKRGRSGFVVQNVMYQQDVKNIIPVFF